jgi:hypothetical protein
MTENNNLSIDLAKKIIRIERQCFYGEESEKNRLKKIRELLHEAEKKAVNKAIKE